MRITPFFAITGLLGITRFTGTFGAPVKDDAVLPTHSENGSLTKRTPPIPMVSVAKDTWQGKESPSVFLTVISNNQLKEYAKATYESLKSKRKDPLMVAVISVPGGGLAAGTVWHGTESDFENNFLVLAPRTRQHVSGQYWSQSGLAKDPLPSKWHAEIVAAQKAEVEYGDKMTGGDQWPSGTKICIYGQIEVGGDIRYFPPCSERSSASISCTWVVGFHLGMAVVT